MTNPSCYIDARHGLHHGNMSRLLFQYIITDTETNIERRVTAALLIDIREHRARQPPQIASESLHLAEEVVAAPVGRNGAAFPDAGQHMLTCVQLVLASTLSR